jgi:DNA-binding PadR family transcriptional regulator
MEHPLDSPPPEPLSEATFFILLCLAPGPSHGYAIIKEVQRLSDGRIALSTGTLYGAIKRLLELGWICRVGDPAPEDTTRTPKRYALTEAGRRTLAAEAERLRALLHVAERYMKEAV